ncbi:hypothetical protein ACWEN6_00985 [Sphaerisporangium sp. NPDC004334]
MVVASDLVTQDVAALYGTVLAAFNDELKRHGVAGRVVRVIRLRLRPQDYAVPRYVSPELEVRGADRQLRATVTIVPSSKDLAYCVRPVDDDLRFLFPVKEAAEALGFLVGRARDWQAPR